MPAPISLTGTTFGRLKVIAEAESHRAKGGALFSRLLCECRCGSILKVRKAHLVSGKTQSCGCLCYDLRCEKKVSLHPNPNLARLGCSETIVKRFWRKVNKTQSCWLWIGSRNQKGYGLIGPGSAGSMIGAHRLSWALHHGSIPDGLWVLHHCDNPPCVRPEHLWLGSNHDNVRDRELKDRHRI